MKDNMLSEVYSNALGAQSYLNEVARIAGQISNRYPHVNVLEIGEIGAIGLDFACEILTSFERCGCWRGHRNRAS